MFCSTFTLTLTLAGAAMADGMTAAEAPIQTGRRFACTDYSQGKVFIVNPDGKIEWEYPAKHCNDIWS